MTTFSGVRHVGLTVTDLDRSTDWYTTVLGFKVLFRESAGQRTAVVMGLPGTRLALGLVHFADGANDRFSPFRTGLDHLCFTVSSREELDAWVARLNAHGVENSGVDEAAVSPMLNFKDPDGIALSFAAQLDLME